MSQTHDNAELALPQGTLLEGIVTTVREDGSPNVSPMGPIVDSDFRRMLLRPFRTSSTLRNLERTGEGVLHVTDDVELLAHAAVGRLDPLPELVPATAVRGYILADACRWYAFRAKSIDVGGERAKVVAEVVDNGRIRDFFGFNRAKHAVIEAAILATRIEFLPPLEILHELERLAVQVQKTAGEQETRAFEFLDDYVRQQILLRQQQEMAAQ